MSCALFPFFRDYGLAAWVREGKEGRLVGSAFDSAGSLKCPAAGSSPESRQMTSRM